MLLVLIIGCKAENKADIPLHIQELDNLTIYPVDMEPARQIQFNREQIFSSVGDVFIGSMGSIAVDNSSRVFIADSKQFTIHVFDSTGAYVTNIGREGAGPGEFRTVGLLSTTDDFLSVYDVLQRRFSIFSLDLLDLSHTLNLNRISTDEIEALQGMFPGAIYFMGKNKYLVEFGPPLFSNPSHPGYNPENQFKQYYLANNKGQIISSKILELEDYRVLRATVQGENQFTQFEFLGKSLLDLSIENYIYTARSDDFLIEVRDSKGNYLRAFYYPIEKLLFTREDAIRRQKEKYRKSISGYRVSVIKNAPDEDIPQSWPVLNDMLVDDKNRLWISTIVDDPNVYQWWVLNHNGKLLARFTWPRNKQIEVVKKGKLYAREKGKETGLEQIVRYQIVMK